jgi:hypothetical protein
MPHKEPGQATAADLGGTTPKDGVTLHGTNVCRNRLEETDEMPGGITLNRRVLRLLACASLLAVSCGLQADPVEANAPTAEIPSPAQLAPLTQSEIALLDSGEPVDVLMDPSTGAILSVTAAAGVVPDVSIRGVCDAGDGCYLTSKVPYADEGFYGSAGTYDGSWAYRSGYSSGNYTVSACWTTNCGVKIGPDSHVTFSSDVTGTSFTIH